MWLSGSPSAALITMTGRPRRAATARTLARYGKPGAAPAANAGGFELLREVAGKHRAAVAREVLFETERPPRIEPGEQPRGGIHADLRKGRRRHVGSRARLR